MTFPEYCKDKIDIGVFNITLSEDDFVKHCKKCFGIGGMSSAELNIQYGFGQQDFLFQEKIDGQMVTMFKGSWSELYHLLREQYGKEDKQLTLW